MLKTKSKTGYIGIDVGTYAIKVAQVEQVETGLQLVDAKIIPRQTPWVFKNWLNCLPVSSEHEIIAARTLGDKFTGMSAAATVSMALCDVRQLATNSQLDDSHQRQAIQDELEKVERFAGEPRTFDYWNIPAPWASSDDDVYVLSLRQSWANQIGRDIRNAKLNCINVDGAPTALARAVKLSNPELQANTPYVILDLGLTRTTLCVIHNNQPVFARMLRQCGFQNIVSALKEKLSLTNNQAHQLFRQCSAAEGPNPTQLQSLLKPVLNPFFARLAKEVNRTTKFSSRVNAPLAERMFLFGAGAAMPDMEQHLTEKCGLTATAWAMELSESVADKGISLPLFGGAAAMSCLPWSVR